MTENIIVCGDIHLSEKTLKRKQVENFFTWFFTQSFNTSFNELILLGDLVESVDAVPELLEIFLDSFINRSHFKKIMILQGNHDCSIITSILSVFRPLQNVQIITSELFLENYNNLNLLFLPHYKHEGTGKEKLQDYYSNLQSDLVFDFGFTHVFDETIPLNMECSLSHLKVKQYLSGHYHICTLQEGGHYLGSPILNSKAESGKTPYIASISCKDKRYSLIEVPKFLEYYEVEYPKELPPINTPYAFLTIAESIDKLETISYYQSIAKSKDIEIGFLKILSKRATEASLVLSSRGELESDRVLFAKYADKNKLEAKVKNLCLEVIAQKEKKENT